MVLLRLQTTKKLKLHIIDNTILSAILTLHLGLISERFNFASNLQNKVTNHDSEKDHDLAPFFGDLSQS